jgi:hypothetical protein
MFIEGYYNNTIVAFVDKTAHVSDSRELGL